MLAVVAFGVVSFAQRITLVAQAPIEVVDRGVADPARTKAAGSISTGEEVADLGFSDMKHYIAPQVERRPASLTEWLTEPSATTSCGGLLGGEKCSRN